MSIPKPSSDTLIEMCYESEPAKWAAHQISTKGYGLKTVGEAMDMIEAIVKEAIKMSQHDLLEQNRRMREILDSVQHRGGPYHDKLKNLCAACRWDRLKEKGTK